MLNLAELNALSAAEFTKLIGPVFEHSPWIAEHAANARPFKSREQLHEALCSTVTNSTEEKKLALIRAHPDLVGRVNLTSESRGEQAAAGLEGVSEDEAALFENYNYRYREKFGFPFVICARLNKKDAILNAFPLRLENSPEQEMQTALREIFKIAELRLRDLVA